MYKQSFRLGICAEMVATSTLFVLKKFLINVFSLKNFFNSFLRKGDLNGASIHDIIYRQKSAIQLVHFQCSVSRISYGGLGVAGAPQ
jgi:hypothetical protein